MNGGPNEYYKKLIRREESLLKDYERLISIMESRISESSSNALTHYRLQESELIRKIERTAKARNRFVEEASGIEFPEAVSSEAFLRGLRSRLIIRIRNLADALRTQMHQLSNEISKIQRPASFSPPTSGDIIPMAIDIHA